MEKFASKNDREVISRNDRLRPEMAFVAIINTDARMRPDPVDWRNEGACRFVDPEIFYPGVGGGVKEAKAVCARCADNVKAVCLEDALEHKDAYGVRGGLTVGEREKLLKKRRQNEGAA